MLPANNRSELSLRARPLMRGVTDAILPAISER
jgi:hypothetical protein